MNPRGRPGNPRRSRVYVALRGVTLQRLAPRGARFGGQAAEGRVVTLLQRDSLGSASRFSAPCVHFTPDWGWASARSPQGPPGSLRPSRVRV